MLAHSDSMQTERIWTVLGQAIHGPRNANRLRQATVAEHDALYASIISKLTVRQLDGKDPLKCYFTGLDIELDYRTSSIPARDFLPLTPCR